MATACARFGHLRDEHGVCLFCDRRIETTGRESQVLAGVDFLGARGHLTADPKSYPRKTVRTGAAATARSVT